MRKHNAHFTGLHLAQEARRADARSGDFDYAMSDGNTRFRSGTHVNTDPAPAAMDPRVAPQMTFLPLRTLTFRVPQPVSVNELYRVNLHTGAKYLTEAQKQFRAQIIGIVRGEMRRAEQRDQPLLGKLEARVLVSERLDIDNGLKSLFDGLQHAKAYVNDRQIKRLIVDCIAMPLNREYCDITLQEIGS